jgi:hypothetical protein
MLTKLADRDHKDVPLEYSPHKRSPQQLGDWLFENTLPVVKSPKLVTATTAAQPREEARDEL